MTSIGDNAFSNCTGLITVTLNNNAIVSKSYTGSSNIKNLFGNQVKEYILGNEVTSIGDYAFDGCSGLTSITIPNSVTSIGKSVFSNCTGLIAVTLNNNAIVSKSYTGSSNIKNLFGNQVKEYILGNEVTSIGDYAFSGCSGLTSITIPNSATSIGEEAFNGCSGLTSITIPQNVAYIGSDAFKDIPTIYVEREGTIPAGIMGKQVCTLREDHKRKTDSSLYRGC